MGPSGKLLGSDFRHACHALDSFEVQCERWSVCVHGEVEQGAKLLSAITGHHL